MHDLRPGGRFGSYRIEAAVGRGGMATVYRAEHEHLRRQVALKVPLAPFAEDPAFRERFIRESRAAATLTHPNVVTVYDAGELEGVLFLAMQYVEGEDLGRVLKRGPLEPARALAVLRQVAAALDAAHAHGLIHRDVKPANVLVHGDHCYLADFGLTKLTDATAATAAGDLLGTLSYAAPEQIEGAEVDHRADVYALGATAFECLVGRTPFAHRAGAALLYAQLTEPPPRATGCRPGLPAAVDAVFARALAKAPGDRYASCGELVAALDAAFAGAPARRALPGPLVRCRAHPVVGRERELEALGAALAGARDGRRVLVCLAGEPGIGKTRVAAELAARAYDAGTTVLFGRADEDPLAPFEPFAEALGSPLPGDLREASASAARAIAGAGRDAPVLLVLEDLQWADKPTLLLLRHVLDAAEPDSLAAIVSFRPLWVGPEHPLADLLAGLVRRHDVRHVELAGLSAEDTARLAADRCDGEPPQGLYERTNGIPLFVEELVRENDPATVHHIVRRRLQRLSEPTRELLTSVARQGGAADPAELGDAEEALAAHVLVERDGRYTLAHTLIRDVLLHKGASPL